MMHQLLRPVRAGVARLLPTGTNAAVDYNSQVQHVFGQKDADFESFPADLPGLAHTVVCAGDWADESNTHLDFQSDHATSSQSSATPQACRWLRNLPSGTLNPSGSWPQQTFNGSVLPSIPFGQLASDRSDQALGGNFDSSTSTPQQEPSSAQPLAELGPMPLIAGTIWMPVMFPFFPTFTSDMTAQPTAVTTDLTQDHGHSYCLQYQGEAVPAPSQPTNAVAPVACHRVPVPSESGNPTSGARRQRRSKKSMASSKEASGTRSPPELSDSRSVANSIVSETSASTSISSPSTSESRISCWADAVDDVADDQFESEEFAGSVLAAETAQAVDPMLQELDCDDKVRQHDAIQWVIQSVWPLTFTSRGCRLVQRALEVASSTDQLLIAEKLQGFVIEALKSPNANHVLQKCIEIMPPEKMQFVVDELKGHGAFAARHRFGCRILQRLTEHCSPMQTEDLISEVLVDASKLVRHQYGNFVIQHILQHGSPDQLHQIAKVLEADAMRLAKHRIASHVVSCALVHCSPEDVQSITQVLLGEAREFADLSRRQYGSFVVREVNRVAARSHGQAKA